MKNKFEFIVPIVFILCSCGNREEVEYYSTGEIKPKASVDINGVYDGDVISYYKNGNVKTIMPFRNHHVNGIVKRYSLQGDLRSTEMYENGKVSGNTKLYYTNGNVEYESRVLNGINIDTSRYYYPDGIIKQMVIYNEKGQKTDFNVWKKDGTIDTSYTKVLFINNEDTIFQNQNYYFEVVLGNRISDMLNVKFLHPLIKIDSAKGHYSKNLYIIKASSLGKNLININVYQSWVKGDTVWTNVYKGQHFFYVKQHKQ